MAPQETVLFCPFCGDGFEGQTHCPEHELALVPWQALPRAKRSDPPLVELPWYSPRLGRGLLAASAALTSVAFVLLPLGRVTGGTATMGGAMLLLALHGAHKLWLLPAAAAVLFALLSRRRTPVAMRAARAAALFTVMIPPVGLWWAWAGVRDAVTALAARTGEPLQLSLGSGAYAIAVALVPGVIGALRLGGHAARIHE